MVSRRLLHISYAVYARSEAMITVTGGGVGLRLITMDTAFAEMPDALWLKPAIPAARPISASAPSVPACGGSQTPKPVTGVFLSNVRFSIAAVVKGNLLTLCGTPHHRSVRSDVATRGSCFSSGSARGRPMMGSEGWSS